MKVKNNINIIVMIILIIDILYTIMKHELNLQVLYTDKTTFTLLLLEFVIVLGLYNEVHKHGKSKK